VELIAQERAARDFMNTRCVERLVGLTPTLIQCFVNKIMLSLVSTKDAGGPLR
jgi:hypothetical protein